MLFNSFPFLLVFLPVAFLGAFVLFRTQRHYAGLLFLVICSLFFYGYWNPVHLWVIVTSVVVNYLLSHFITETKPRVAKTAYLVLGISLNLGALVYFKYAGFFINLLTASHIDDFFGNVVNSALPIGISFYTFQQIAYLVDCYANHARKPYTLTGYAFFVTFFPQLIAGPIVHHAEIMPQLDHIDQRLRGVRYVARFLAPGLALLLVGLGKKVLLADTFGTYADQAFVAGNIAQVTFFDAWASALSYTLQIYFDFSGYSDMAIGMGLLFGLRLPANFLAPYKASSIIEFWRRWHVTLSRFLRDYIYIPLGGNRHGALRRHGNLLATMAIGGLWHGANWTFVLWGVMHGLLLTINHGLRALRIPRPPTWLAVPTTFVFIVFTWVPFRAENLAVVGHFYSVMLGGDGIVVPWTYQSLVAAMGPWAQVFSIRVDDVVFFGGMRQVALLMVGLLIVFLGPNSMRLLERRGRHLALGSRWIPMGLGATGVLVMVAMWLQTNVTFLYFQF